LCNREVVQVLEAHQVPKVRLVFLVFVVRLENQVHVDPLDRKENQDSRERE
jgi:hypothetical protein